MQTTVTTALTDLVGILTRADTEGQLSEALYKVGISDAYNCAIAEAATALGRAGIAEVNRRYEVEVSKHIDAASTDNSVENENSGQLAANKFFDELQASVELLSGIAVTHSVQTLVDAMYLHAAILNDGYIEFIPNQSRIKELLRDLPSAEVWLAFVRDSE